MSMCLFCIVLIELLDFKFFKFYLVGVNAKRIRTSVDLCTCRSAQHLEFVGRWRKRHIAVDQHGVFSVGDGHAGCDWLARRVLIAEAQGILLTEAWGNDEGSAFLERWEFGCLDRFIDRSRTRLGVKR